MKRSIAFLSTLLGSFQCLTAQEAPTFVPGALSDGEAGNFFGCSWADYDNDGWVDLFVAAGFGQQNRLFRNDGNGGFVRVTAGPVATDVADASIGVWGDTDNDGDLDLYVTNYEEPAADFFYSNNGDGTFSRITAGPWSSDGS